MEFVWTCEQDGAKGDFQNVRLAKGVLMMPLTEKGCKNLFMELQLCNQLACGTFIEIHLFNKYLWKN